MMAAGRSMTAFSIISIKRGKKTLTDQRKITSAFIAWGEKKPGWKGGSVLVNLHQNHPTQRPIPFSPTAPLRPYTSLS